MTPRRWTTGCRLAWLSLVVIVAACLAAASGPTPSPGRSERLAQVAELVGSPIREARESAVGHLLGQRAEAVRVLIAQVDPDNGHRHDGEARAAAAYLLGRLRAEEAVPVLARALSDRRLPENRPFVSYSDISPYDAAVWTALVEIGRPSVPAMIEAVGKTDDLGLRQKAMGVLNHVLGGKRHVLELMDKLQGRSTDGEEARRFREACAWAEGHYREDVEPLF